MPQGTRRPISPQRFADATGWDRLPYRSAKRLLDLVVAILASPLLILLAIPIVVAIRLDTPGPIFYSTTRLSKHERPFTVYKFRSMTQHAERELSQVQHLNIMGGPSFKAPADPRITRVGRLLRKSSLDELPQLWNVFRGEMSLVGPRPVYYRDFEGQREVLRLRCSVKPGLTGLWQVSGRSATGHDRMVGLDLEYVERCSFVYDLQLLIRTIPIVLTGRGAL